MAKVANRQALPERNVLKANIMRPPLDFIAEIIKENHWGYMYTCACPVYLRLVREFYGYLEVV
jgi:iron only hydrogenase large subunit-like protein